MLGGRCLSVWGPRSPPPPLHTAWILYIHLYLLTQEGSAIPTWLTVSPVYKHQCCQVPKKFPASTSKKFGQFRKKLGKFPKTNLILSWCTLYVVITAKNKELFWKFSAAPFLPVFGKISQNSATNFFFLRPLLSFLAGTSATWQHW